MAKASNVILVYGAWADGSSWSKVIPLLLAPDRDRGRSTGGDEPRDAGRMPRCDD
jgi:hypothetical protein